MSRNEALPVLRRLRDGFDPSTGAPLPFDHLCQRADVLRALFTAVSALETAPARAGSRAPSARPAPSEPPAIEAADEFENIPASPDELRSGACSEDRPGGACGDPREGRRDSGGCSPVARDPSQTGRTGPGLRGRDRPRSGAGTGTGIVGRAGGGGGGNGTSIGGGAAGNSAGSEAGGDASGTPGGIDRGADDRDDDLGPPVPVVRVPRPRPPKAGQPWSEEDDRQLAEAFDGGAEERELAQAFGRSRSSIRARLIRLGRGALLPAGPAPRYPIAIPLDDDADLTAEVPEPVAALESGPVGTAEGFAAGAVAGLPRGTGAGTDAQPGVRPAAEIGAVIGAETGAASGAGIGAGTAAEIGSEIGADDPVGAVAG